MFGFISKKKLIEEVIRLLLAVDTANAVNEKDFCFRAGVHSGLSGLCSRLGIDITEYLSTAKALEYKKKVLKDKRLSVADAQFMMEIGI